jgi:D-arabinose 1-dehydrogenase-like Zn-dependent alcohol dehydrogenase
VKLITRLAGFSHPMKAIVYTQHGLPIDDANALVEIDLPRPQPGPRDLLVAVRAVSVNHRRPQAAQPR